MLAAEPWAATTPFVKGKTNLPTVEDCRRILGRTRRAYLTAPPHPAKFRDPNRTVEKTVNETARWAHFIPGRIPARQDSEIYRCHNRLTLERGVVRNATTMENYASNYPRANSFSTCRPARGVARATASGRRRASSSSGTGRSSGWPLRRG